MTEICFKGIQGTTLLDFPGRIATIIFTGGCNLRCPYCHNSFLVTNSDEIESINEETVFSFIEERKKFIDGIVVTGGEPLIHKWLKRFLENFKEKFPHLEVKLDTNGCYPELLKEILDENLVKMVAMDIKTSPLKYLEILKTDNDNIQRSIKLLRKYDIEKEYRITCFSPFINKENIIDIAGCMEENDAVFIQQCSEEPVKTEDIDEFVEILEEKKCIVKFRGY